MDNVFRALSCSGYPVLFTSKRRQPCLGYEKNVFSVFFRNDSVNSKRGHPLGIFRAFVMLPGLGGGELVENPCLGVGHLSILLDAVNVVFFFSIFHLKKYVYLNNLRYIYKNFF